MAKMVSCVLVICLPACYFDVLQLRICLGLAFSNFPNCCFCCYCCRLIKSFLLTDLWSI